VIPSGRWRSGWVGLLGCAAAALVVGCVAVGPRAIRGSRTDYNVALRQTEDEQLLLNLVRLRYRDRPLFLEATALNTQFSYAPSAEAAVGFGPGPGVETEYGLGGRIAYEEKPTVTYTPLQGADYVTRMLSAVPVESMALLDSSGWSTERVFRTCVQSLNGLDNASRASGPTPQEVPDYEEFVRATRLLRALELTGGVEGARQLVGDQVAVVLRIAGPARGLPEFRELTSLLGLDPDAESYVLAERQGPGGGNLINLRTRSLAGVLYFLSQAVEVPQADVEAGRVTVTRDASGAVFDWGRVTEGVMRIRSSGSRPESAAVAVHYRGSWFYIDDADLDSKSTFSMVAQLYALQAGNARGLRPVLTLPVGD